MAQISLWGLFLQMLFFSSSPWAQGCLPPVVSPKTASTGAGREDSFPRLFVSAAPARKKQLPGCRGLIQGDISELGSPRQVCGIRSLTAPWPFPFPYCWVSCQHHTSTTYKTSKIDTRGPFVLHVFSQPSALGSLGCSRGLGPAGWQLLTRVRGASQVRGQDMSRPHLADPGWVMQKTILSCPASV